MPLTLGPNVSNDHLLMISISYHHFYVLFISYTMISYNSARERSGDLWPALPALPRSKLRSDGWEKAWTNLNFILIPTSHYHINH